MAKSWLIDSRSIARKVKDATLCSAKQIKDCGAKRQCPNCRYWINNSDVCYEWPGLPAGVKFDPSDVELLEHLAAKCGLGHTKPHMFIDEFIPTLDEDRGICYTHPKDLPGAKKDGTSIHFFHKTRNAYASGQRKRRKILSEESTDEKVRWHKTGKTKPVMENGIQKGFKKIMVLYRCTSKGSKPVKSNWVMHQYHLGIEEDEKEGVYVVSKITYQQPKDTERNTDVVENGVECTDVLENEVKQPTFVTNPAGPHTPGTSIPMPPRRDSPLICYETGGIHTPGDQKPTTNEGSNCVPSPLHNEYIDYNSACCPAGESQAFDLESHGLDDPLLCREILSCCEPHGESHKYGLNGLNEGGISGGCGLTELEGLEFDTPPDFSLSDLNFGSQDSIFAWLDKL